MIRCTPVLLATMLLVAATISPSYADTLAPRQPQIVGGADVPDPNPYVWQVSLGAVGQSPKDGHFCGGSLIAARWVLSAAHCFEPAQVSDPSTLQVVVGVRTLSSATATNIYPISRVVVHSEYNAQTYINDIALVELATAVEDPGLLITMVAPAEDAALTAAETLATLTGWGGLKGYPAGEEPPADQTYPDVLQVVAAPIVGNAACALSSAGLTAKQLCAGYAEGGRDTCQADSGGPLVVRDSANRLVLAGVVSNGQGCAAAGYPAIYTRVSSYADWVQAIMAPSQLDEQLYLPTLGQSSS